MWAIIGCAALVLQLVSGQHEHRFFKFPVKPGHNGQCHDPRVDKYYDVGEVWGPKNSNCKQSRCVEEKGVLYIDRMSCDRILDNVDFDKMKREHLSCRQAIGDRREPFPGCCPQLVCYEYINGKKKRIPKERLPLIKPIIRDHFVYARQ
ncbi:hypothetical protein FJT64_026531 [Amphibalanus amphitrite]|uniref:Single domain-containing protein n=1 Tax=Amphibalanus amphitrite TaxID=1232801 RepID=A0A6A4WBC2_AMPAM|nr:uncharacterized protein LOC122368663 [Amphibalanus amphitrite]KAF0301104.1 hypothetical protein FJT64_026531 [Amphibalanus amphitrite]